jgi:uncharacterized protein YggT (Ycf19 family)
MAILYQILYYGFLVLYFYYFLMVVQILLSWTPIVRTKFYEILDKITGPYMHMFRGWLVLGQMDFTPMLGIILFQLLLSFIGGVL